MRRSVRMLIAIAVVLVLTGGTIALAAGGWNVLAFLGLRDGHMAAELVTPVAAAARQENCFVRIDSAMTDGSTLAFDWTVENITPDAPFFIQVEKLTGNGVALETDGTDDFNHQWFPGIFNGGIMQGGNLASLPDAITGYTLQVEMTIGIYRPTKPVHLMTGFDPRIARQKLDEGCYVIADGEGFVIDDPEVGLLHVFGPANETTSRDLRRSVMILTFELDLAAGKKDARALPLPAPAASHGLTLQYRSACLTPLKVALSLQLHSEGMSYDDACSILSQGFFTLTDSAGSSIDCAVLEGMGGVEQLPDGSWCVCMDYAFTNDASLPDSVSLSYVMDDGRCCTAPIRIR